MTYNVFGGTLNLAQFNSGCRTISIVATPFLKFTHYACTTTLTKENVRFTSQLACITNGCQSARHSL